jgi:GNAT superfamily N-acetyltransferase
MTAAGGTVRALTAADVPEASAMLARAFADKSPFDWIEPDPARRTRVLPAMFSAALRWMFPPGSGPEVFEAGGRILGVAGWAPPGKWKPSPWVQLRALPGMLRALGGFSNLAAYGKRGQAVEASLHGAHPKVPHWYLAMLGVDPDVHTTGIGGALVRSGLSRADRNGMPVYLECVESLVPYYRRFGFEETGRIAMPEGTLDQIGMWRMTG